MRILVVEDERRMAAFISRASLDVEEALTSDTHAVSEPISVRSASGVTIFRSPIGGGRQVGPDLQSTSGLDDPLAIMSAMWNHSSAMEQELRKPAKP